MNRHDPARRCPSARAPDGEALPDELATFEDELHELSAAPLPPALATRIRACLGEEPAGAGTTGRPFGWPWIAAAAALVLVLAVAASGWHGRRGGDGIVTAAGVSPPSGAASEPVRVPREPGPASFRPLGHVRHVLQTHDGGVLVAPGLGAVRPVGFEAVEEAVFECETDGSRLRVSTPRDGVVLLPVKIY